MPKRNLPPISTGIREMKYFKNKYVQFFKILENLDISRVNFMQTQNLTQYILQYSKLLNEGNIDSKLTAYKSNNTNYYIRENNDM